MTHQVWNQEASEYTGRLGEPRQRRGAVENLPGTPEPVAASDPSPEKRDLCVRSSSRAE
jgi:hypothetical protein